MTTLHDFTPVDLDGHEHPLSQYAGRLVLAVNTSHACGFTWQYGGLQMLWERYRGRGLVVLGFPSDSFSGDTSDHETIRSFANEVYRVDFPLLAPIELTGPRPDPLWSWLACTAGPVAWNFTKFLVGPDGMPIARFGAATAPRELVPTVEEHLGRLVRRGTASVRRTAQGSLS